MGSTNSIILNGKLITSTKACFFTNNRSFRYGDGCFETLRMLHGKIPLWRYHWQRLYQSIQTLKLKPPLQFSEDTLLTHVQHLASRNHHSSSARIRITVFRGDGDLFECNQPLQYLIESFAVLPPAEHAFEQGLKIILYKDALKTCDVFSAIKSNNYIASVMAVIFAKEQGADDAIIFNQKGNICETSIANIFIIKNNKIQTPAITEGCVAGTMRAYLLNCFKKDKMLFEETALSLQHLKEADEVFLTNAMYGIRWVQNCNDVSYHNKVSARLYKKYISALFS